MPCARFRRTKPTGLPRQSKRDLPGGSHVIRGGDVVIGRDVRALLCVALLVPASAPAVDTDYRSVREVPARGIPVPTTVSPRMQSLIARPATAPQAPQSAQEW